MPSTTNNTGAAGSSKFKNGVPPPTPNPTPAQPNPPPRQPNPPKETAQELLSKRNLVAEAVKRASIAVVVRDLEEWGM